ncbi:transposase [Desulfuromonas sp.]|uniref:transposase n=1 Tax=Desulfuromonas sp. TaxID=892 RepID=UPI0025BD1CED|nr:transposase [Desulfuromonas sp.]
MPRHARIDIPGLLQHVIVRGIERRPVFRDEQDREGFLLRLSTLLRETETDCYAWALPDNHFHLLLRPRGGKLGGLMRRLLTGYTVVFNLRHNRSGHLFQNRYKSIVCDENPYLVELVRYIHLNPLRAGKVKDLDGLDYFPWCGHAELLGRSPRNLIRADDVLALFSPRRIVARDQYRSFLADGCPKVKLLRGGRGVSRVLDPSLAKDAIFDDRCLCGGAFVERVLEGEEGEAGRKRPSLSDLERVVAEHFQIPPAVLRRPSKERPACPVGVGQATGDCVISPTVGTVSAHGARPARAPSGFKIN